MAFPAVDILGPLEYWVFLAVHYTPWVPWLLLADPVLGTLQESRVFACRYPGYPGIRSIFCWWWPGWRLNTEYFWLSVSRYPEILIFFWLWMGVCPGILSTSGCQYPDYLEYWIFFAVDTLSTMEYWAFFFVATLGTMKHSVFHKYPEDPDYPGICIRTLSWPPLMLLYMKATIDEGMWGFAKFRLHVTGD